MGITTHKRGIAVYYKLNHYEKLINDGLTVDELKEVRKRIYRIKDECLSDWCQKRRLLQCIKELLEESK